MVYTIRYLLDNPHLIIEGGKEFETVISFMQNFLQEDKKWYKCCYDENYCIVYHQEPCPICKIKEFYQEMMIMFQEHINKKKLINGG